MRDRDRHTARPSPNSHAWSAMSKMRRCPCGGARPRKTWGIPFGERNQIPELELPVWDISTAIACVGTDVDAYGAAKFRAITENA